MKFQSNQAKLQSNQTETLHDVFMSQWSMEDDLRDSDAAVFADSDSNVESTSFPFLLMLRIAILAAPPSVVFLKMFMPMLYKLLKAFRFAHVVKGEVYIPK